jgi:hypothetical protein
MYSLFLNFGDVVVKSLIAALKAHSVGISEGHPYPCNFSLRKVSDVN